MQEFTQKENNRKKKCPGKHCGASKYRLGKKRGSTNESAMENFAARVSAPRLPASVARLLPTSCPKHPSPLACPHVATYKRPVPPSAHPPLPSSSSSTPHPLQARGRARGPSRRRSKPRLGHPCRVSLYPAAFTWTNRWRRATRWRPPSCSAPRTAAASSASATRRRRRRERGRAARRTAAAAARSSPWSSRCRPRNAWPAGWRRRRSTCPGRTTPSGSAPGAWIDPMRDGTNYGLPTME